MNADKLIASDQFEPYTRVVLTTGKEGDNTKYCAGDETGRTLTVEIPWADQAKAEAILQTVSNYAYQPFTANGATVDPAVELGDMVSIGSVTAPMWSQDITFGQVKSSTIKAPGEEEIDHEFTFTPERERKVNRTLGGHAKQLKDQEGKIITVDSGLNQIADITYDDDGNPVAALAEAKVFAAVTVDGAFKEAYLQTNVGWDATGNPVSFAKLVGDVIELHGNVYIKDGFLYVDNRIITNDIIKLDNPGKAYIASAYGNLDILGSATIGEGYIKTGNALFCANGDIAVDNVKYRPQQIIIPSVRKGYFDGNASGSQFAIETLNGGTLYWHEGAVDNNVYTVYRKVVD